MTDKKGNNIKPPSTKPTESTENADGVKPAYFRKSETVRGKKKGAYSYEPPQTGGYVSTNIVEIALYLFYIINQKMQ